MDFCFQKHLLRVLPQIAQPQFENKLPAVDKTQNPDFQKHLVFVQRAVTEFLFEYGRMVVIKTPKFFQPLETNRSC